MKTITLIDGNNQFTFNDNADGTILREFEGFEYPLVRSVIEDIPARDGSVYIGSQFGRRRLSWSGDVVNPNIFSRRREMLSTMSQGGLKTLQFTTYDDLELQTEVQIVKVVMPYNHKVHNYLIEAIAPDYRFYSQNLITLNSGVTSVGGGMAVPAPVPAPIGGGVSTPLILDNQGNAISNPTITIHGPGTNFVVTNLDTGQSFSLNLTLTASESVVIDTLNRTAFKGTTNVFGSFSGDWFYLQSGNNRVVFNAQSGTTDDTDLIAQYRSAYIGI